MASRQLIDGQASRGWRTGVAIGWRWLTAVVGGYGFAVVTAMLAARLLPVSGPESRVEATGWPMLLSFLVYAGVGLWALHALRLARTSAVVWGGIAVMAALLWWLGVRA